MLERERERELITSNYFHETVNILMVLVNISATYQLRDLGFMPTHHLDIPWNIHHHLIEIEGSGV